MNCEKLHAKFLLIINPHKSSFFKYLSRVANMWPKSKTTLHAALTKFIPYQRLKINILIKYRSQFIIIKT